MNTGTYQKFKRHLKEGGFFYAFYRGIKYFLFLFKRYKSQKELMRGKRLKVAATIQNQDLKIICYGGDVKIFWRDVEITKNVGLSSSICTLKSWDNSHRAQWQVEERGTIIIAKNKWEDLPISQIWKIWIDKEGQILWVIDMEVEELLELEERRVGLMVSSEYKRWVNSYEEKEFPLIKEWKDMKLKYLDSRCIGVRGYIKDEKQLPSILFDFSQEKLKALPQIQNTDCRENARVLQVRMPGKKRYSPGTYRYFSGKILILEDELAFNDYLNDFKKE